MQDMMLFYWAIIAGVILYINIVSILKKVKQDKDTIVNTLIGCLCIMVILVSIFMIFGKGNMQILIIFIAFLIVVFSFPIISSCINFKKGKLVWIAPIIYSLFYLLCTLSLIFDYIGYKGYPNGFVWQRILIGLFFPILLIWSTICTLVAIFIRLLKDKNEKSENNLLNIKSLTILLLILLSIVSLIISISNPFAQWAWRIL